MYVLFILLMNSIEHTLKYVEHQKTCRTHIGVAPTLVISYLAFLSLSLSIYHSLFQSHYVFTYPEPPGPIITKSLPIL